MDDATPRCRVGRIGAADTLVLRQRELWPDHPVEHSMLPGDAAGIHVGAWLGDELVCVASLFVDGDDARLRKFATAAAHRSLGIGSAVLTEVIRIARAEGARVFWCDARLTATGLYRRFGMAPEGGTFFKKDIEYVRMAMPLEPDESAADRAR